MPNSTSDPHGKVTASATPRSMMSRTSGAEDCTLVPPSRVTKLAMVAWAGRTFMPLTSSGTRIFLVRGIDLVFDGAAGILFDRRTPVLQRLLQRMRRRHPVRQFQLKSLFLRQR